MKKTYLLTGASGFVGSVLLRKLVKRKENVHIILRETSNVWRIKDILSKVQIHYTSLSNIKKLIKLIRKIKFNIIFHLATNGAYSYQKDANEIINTNILGTWNLLQACSTIDYELFVNTGSSSEYGFKEYAMRETDILEPTSYYAVTKCAQTLLCNHIANQEDRPIVTIRLFSVYGPFEEPRRFIPTLLKALYFKEEMNLVSPDIARDYIYIDDLVGVYLKIEGLKKFKGEFFNIGTGVQSTIKEVVEKAIKITGKNTRFNWKEMKPRTWDTNNWVADISKARKLLRWTPKINLEDGLRLTWEWFKNNKSFYK